MLIFFLIVEFDILGNVAVWFTQLLLFIFNYFVLFNLYVLSSLNLILLCFWHVPLELESNRACADLPISGAQRSVLYFFSLESTNEQILPVMYHVFLVKHEYSMKNFIRR